MSKSKLLEQYKDHPEAIDFINKNKELFFKNRHDTSKFSIPEEKDTNLFHYLFLLTRKRSREIMQDLMAGLSNTEIAVKYNFKDSISASKQIHKIKSNLEIKIKKYKNNNFRRNIKRNGQVYKADIEKAINYKSFTIHTTNTIFVYLCDIGEDRKFKLNAIDILDTETSLYYQTKYELIQHKVDIPHNLYKELLNVNIYDKFLILKQQELIKILQRFQWVDEKGLLFTPELDRFITIANNECDIPEFMEIYN